MLRVAVCFSAVAVLAIGCGSDKSTEPTPQPTLTPNDTPQHTMQRLVQTYERKRVSEYPALFTADFAFEFSNASDPDLVQKFSTGWWHEDEKVAARNLFQGGNNSDGEFQPAASRIELQLANDAPAGDTTGGKNPDHYKVLRTAIVLEIEVPPRPGQSQSTTYVIGGGLDPSMHRFFLVRGDHAQALSAGQPADAQHWYVYRWHDETGRTAKPQGPKTPTPAEETSSWGRVKNLYR